jgi:hypothetical protein
VKLNQRAVVVLALTSAVLVGQPGWRDPVLDMLSGLTAGNAYRHENLTLYPLYGRGGLSVGLVLLDEAIQQGVLQVQEKGGGQVNTVRVRNRGKSYVFGMAGEIVSGARQDRMLQDDILMPPGSGWLDVPVYCTEHGRWQGESMSFGTKGDVAAGGVRARASQTRSQGEVWAEVDAARGALDVTSPTRAFAKVYEEPRVQEKLDDYTEHLGSLPQMFPGAVGVVVAVGSRVVCVDVFGSPSLFGRMWPKLLRSYVIDAVSQQPHGSLSAREVRRFTAGAARADLAVRASVGSGVLLSLSAARASGSALRYNREVVHIDLFPGSPEHESDGQDQGNAPRLDVRRQRSRD